jgi:transglutaminase-like putative cysteine protease
MFYGSFPTLNEDGRWFELSAGDRGIGETVALMGKMARESMGHPEVKQVAVMATQGVAKVDPARYAEAVFFFAKRHFRFVPDIAGVEELTSPTIHSRRILEKGGTFGDCDDFSLAQAAWLMAVGVPARFTVIASPKHKGAFDHVRVEAKTQYGWQPMETTVKRSRFGESFPVLRAHSWDV